MVNSRLLFLISSACFLAAMVVAWVIGSSAVFMAGLAGAAALALGALIGGRR